LPEIYSVSALTIEERITKEFILLKVYVSAIVILNDLTMIDKTMYITLQIMEII